MERKDIKLKLEYLKGFGYLSDDNIIILWNLYKELYGKDFPGSHSCQECIRTEMQNMLINLTND
jgi:hypothetical protein